MGVWRTIHCGEIIVEYKDIWEKMCSTLLDLKFTDLRILNNFLIVIIIDITTGIDIIIRVSMLTKIFKILYHNPIHTYSII